MKSSIKIFSGIAIVIFIIAGSRYMADMNVEEGESKNEKD